MPLSDQQKRQIQKLFADYQKALNKVVTDHQHKVAEILATSDKKKIESIRNKIKTKK